MQLNDTHLVLLSAAGQRDDKFLVPPRKLGQKAADKLAARLTVAGLVELLVVTAHHPQWGTSPDGEPVGLRITAAGLDALGVERDTLSAPAMPPAGDDGRDGAEASPAAEQADGAVEEHPSRSREESAPDERSDGLVLDCETSPSGVSNEEATGVVVLPRPNSKRALLIAMLQREEGASVETIMAAMGWLPHSTRAALTGLRKAGHQLVKSKDAAARTIYRLIDPAAATGNPVNDAAE